MEYIFFGLGNPGDQYKDTRHNAGRMALEKIHDVYGFSNWRFESKQKARISNGELAGTSVTLACPETFMNRSGDVVKALNLTAADAARVVVFYDDIDLAVGTFKISHNKNAGGHNGLASIIDALGTREFVRVRLGIAPKTFFGTVKKPRGNTAEYVLSSFTPRERRKCEDAITHAADAACVIVTEGYQAAMNRFN